MVNVKEAMNLAGRDKDGEHAGAQALRREIRDRMKSSGMRITAVAKQAGISHGRLSDFMNGRTDGLKLENLQAIAGVFDATVGELLRERNDGGGVRRTMPFDKIKISPDNPRTSFPVESIASLAWCIEAIGVKTPLHVTPSGLLEDGERRFRAIAQLVNDGKLPPDMPVPVHLVAEPTAPGETVIAGLVINLQREDLPPLDEARAMARLIDEFDWTVVAIANAAGVTARHVQLRLDLVNKLAPTAHEALESGKLKLAHARVLTAAPIAQQKTALKQIINGSYGWSTTDEIRRTLFEDMVPVGRNLFKLKAYSGEFVTDHSDDGDQRYFRDTALFSDLQRAAAAEKKAELEALGYQWVDLVDRTNHETWNQGDWMQDEKRNPAWCGACVVIEYDMQVIIHLGLFKSEGEADHQISPAMKTARDAAATVAGKQKQTVAATQPAKITKAHMIACSQAKTVAIQTAIADQPMMALRAAVLGLLAGGAGVKIRRGNVHREDRAGHDMLEARMSRYAPLFKNIRGHFEDGVIGIDRWSGSKHAEAWNILCGMPDDAVQDMHAILIADLCGSWNEGNPSGLGDGPVPIAMAETLRIDMVDHFTLTRDFLETCGKPMLLHILAESDQATNADRMRDMKSAKVAGLVDMILDDVKRGNIAGYVPPGVKFGSPLVIEAAMPRKAG